MSSHLYEQDIIAWANQQGEALRVGRFDALDLRHLADEIEDVGHRGANTLGQGKKIGSNRLSVEAYAGRMGGLLLREPAP